MKRLNVAVEAVVTDLRIDVTGVTVGGLHIAAVDRDPEGTTFRRHGDLISFHDLPKPVQKAIEQVYQFAQEWADRQ